MAFAVRNRCSQVALVAGMVAAAWSPASFACSDTPVLASMCVMAVPYTFGNFNNQFTLAAGQDLSINSYAALYSLIGTIYGSSNTSSFKLPDLRGRFVIAADGVNYAAGAKGGNNAITLTTSQLPPHLFTVTGLPVAISGLTVSSTLPTLNATVNIASATATGTVTGLKLNVVGGSGGVTSPSGNYLGKSTSNLVNVYSSATPDATLNAGAISGGTVSVTVPASSATATVAGGAVMAGVVGGAATVSGNTNIVGTGSAIDIRPSYIAMTYYIATNGIYPSRD